MRYVYSIATKQLHDRAHAEERCNLDDAKHLQGVDLKTFMALIRDGADCCDWCFGEERHGKWFTSPAQADSVTSSPDSS